MSEKQGLWRAVHRQKYDRTSVSASQNSADSLFCAETRSAAAQNSIAGRSPASR
ncbi:MAG: hypothetical protein JGK17_21670 [Microcoleus sp. PH2017_10_PVI_O_A]|uniref:hypothetical protein n=1 Tax=unclassified Microcoleus TaxID=2642155 RepID=UPI001E025C94|nr:MULTISPECIES: hypothetical protein [unclassified Microcoleus]MCC3408147.1 hypothetical protein [Microcoleus sp. PH2017_10_PVI_O_A]MCC3462270.1 hypothetical protein [Microcoleus sp. PH2017_11_PCY_U_A]MCC3480661.1 hypothetical protein [Microcoleus sp. PH2017_12_PCY_D_A]MCC3530621.1 hypothetical protein [Microcoleus sp. PH2017_21_RUC_O_A]MCC3543008.1 hypothetical protein [Microcoleus sp. PH2017_22_RUC_O_B]